MSETILKERKKSNVRNKENIGRNACLAKERLGMTKLNKQGKQMTIVSYVASNKITIKFEGEDNLIKSAYSNFEIGTVKSYSDSLVCGHGILGSENPRDIKGDVLKSYECWKGIIKRCFSEKEKLKNPTYRDVTCCDDWIYYKNFKKFYDENFYKIEGHTMELDKDILHKGNKIYSPETCVFTITKINNLFIKNNVRRGAYPLGVRFYEPCNKYFSVCRNNKSEKVRSAYVDTPELAFNAYKIFKEKTIKEVADEYKSQIPLKLYDAMYSYIVEITD